MNTRRYVSGATFELAYRRWCEYRKVQPYKMNSRAEFYNFLGGLSIRGVHFLSSKRNTWSLTPMAARRIEMLTSPHAQTLLKILELRNA